MRKGVYKIDNARSWYIHTALGCRPSTNAILDLLWQYILDSYLKMVKIANLVPANKRLPGGMIPQLFKNAHWQHSHHCNELWESLLVLCCWFCCANWNRAARGSIYAFGITSAILNWVSEKSDKRSEMALRVGDSYKKWVGLIASSSGPFLAECRPMSEIWDL